MSKTPHPRGSTVQFAAEGSITAGKRGPATMGSRERRWQMLWEAARLHVACPGLGTSSAHHFSRLLTACGGMKE